MFAETCWSSEGIKTSSGPPIQRRRKAMNESPQTPMTKQKMAEYFEAHSTDDFERTASLYLTEDILFENPLFNFVGQDSYSKFITENLTNLGIRELIRPKNMLIDGNIVAAEVDVELIFSKDMPEFPFRPIKKGESVVLNNGVFYEIRNGRIARISVYWMKYLMNGVETSVVRT
jgi:hypothetical protein